MVKLHLEENGFQMVFEGVEAIEDAVMEGLLTQVIPEVLNRCLLYTSDAADE